MTQTTSITGRLVEIGNLVDHGNEPGLIIDAAERGRIVVLAPREFVRDAAKHTALYEPITLSVSTP